MAAESYMNQWLLKPMFDRDLSPLSYGQKITKGIVVSQRNRRRGWRAHALRPRGSVGMAKEGMR